MKITLAVFRSIECSDDSKTVLICDSDGYSWGDDSKNYIRLTENVVIDFPDVSQEIIVSKELQAIDQTEKALREKFDQQIAVLNGRRLDLAALPAPKGN